MIGNGQKKRDLCGLLVVRCFFLWVLWKDSLNRFIVPAALD